VSTKWEIHQLKAEASFVADDPWNANRRDTFALDYYVWVTPGTIVRPNSKPAGAYRHGIRAKLSGVAHDLPDSLYFAWRARRINAESLPRLLHELQPTLKKGTRGDYGIGLSNKTFTAAVWIMALWMAAADAVWVDEVRGYAMPLLLAILFAAVFPVIIGWMFYRVVYQVWQRRMAQTKWILARA
jgi:hypothetical protein